MDTSINKCAIIAILLIASGCDRGSTSAPGARVVPLEFSYLLPDGKKWSHEIVLPRDATPGTVLTLELRRFPNAESGLGTSLPFPRKDAEEIVTLASFKIAKPGNLALVSLQLLNVRDYSSDSAITDPIKLLGGLNVGEGGMAKIQCPQSFIRGEPGSISPTGNTNWDKNEMRLLRFWTRTGELETIYDVCVILSTELPTEKQAEPSDAPQPRNQAF